jgi:hypothetical protein
MRWASFEASQSNFDYDEFGENLKNEYDPYSSRDLFDKKKINFEQRLMDAAKEFNNNNLQG